MQVEPALALPIFQSAIAAVRTPWGISYAVSLVGVLLTVGILPLRSGKPHWWAFSGAVLGTILVDSLFLLVAATNWELFPLTEPEILDFSLQMVDFFGNIH